MPVWDDFIGNVYLTVIDYGVVALSVALLCVAFYYVIQVMRIE